jgi:hypothetical protein
MPIEDHILPHCLIIGTSQILELLLQLKIKYQRYPYVHTLIKSINLFICSIPAINVVTTAAYSNVVNFLTISLFNR